MRFAFSTAAKILFGSGTLAQVPEAAFRMGRRALVVRGGSPERAAGLVGSLRGRGVEAVEFGVSREPTVDLVLAGAALAREHGCELVIGMGGGSVIDAGKAIAAMLGNPGDIFEYLEVIGRAQPLPEPPAPYIAVPTTAGTGAEVTRNAVLISPEHQVKVSMRSDLMMPDLVVSDPELTRSLPPDVTASTGLDALTQLIEALVSVRANPLTDGLCREGLQRAARSLHAACADGTNMRAREDMMLAGLFSGMALANAGLGAVHGFAAPLGGMIDAPHGAICARLLPIVMEANIHALTLRDPRSPALARFDEIARVLSEDPKADARQGIAWVSETCRDLRIQTLGRLGLTRDRIPVLVERAMRASSMKGNPVALTKEELTGIIEEAL